MAYLCLSLPSKLGSRHCSPIDLQHHESAPSCNQPALRVSQCIVSGEHYDSGRATLSAGSFVHRHCKNDPGISSHWNSAPFFRSLSLSLRMAAHVLSRFSNEFMKELQSVLLLREKERTKDRHNTIKRQDSHTEHTKERQQDKL